GQKDLYKHGIAYSYRGESEGSRSQEAFAFIFGFCDLTLDCEESLIFLDFAFSTGFAALVQSFVFRSSRTIETIRGVVPWIG
ncbi:MAG: hypothetical protein OEY31_14685, partial [Candidatus Bathyarchaeota archaeon]|nr:hypothetical protein [Candidatus Bathyarchaeota archaeon]